MVVHGQRVAQLDAESQALLGRHPLQRVDQLTGAVVAQVLLEDGVGDVDLGEAQVVVQDARARALCPSSVGFILTTVCRPRSSSKIAGDALDLVGRAAVHRRQGHAVDQSRRDLDVGELREVARAASAWISASSARGIGQPVHEARHARALDAVQVVADAHVEDRAERRVLPAQQRGAGRGSPPRR